MLRRWLMAALHHRRLLSVGPLPAQAQCAVATDPCLTAAGRDRRIAGAARRDRSRHDGHRGRRPRRQPARRVPQGCARRPPSSATSASLVDANDYAVGLARTGAFFSNDQAPLSSRTVRFISGIHFPPGMRNKPPAALYGIENTNRGCDLRHVQCRRRPSRAPTGRWPAACRARAAPPRGCGTGIVTGKADLFDSNPAAVDPGGVPIFKDGRARRRHRRDRRAARRSAEFAALRRQRRRRRRASGRAVPVPGRVFLDGIRLPFVEQTRCDRPAWRRACSPGASSSAATPSPLGAAGVPSGLPGRPQRRRAADALAQVDRHRQQAVARPRTDARRDPPAARQRDPHGHRRRPTSTARSSAVFRMPDATVFCIDVAVAKARNVVYFSSAGRDPRDLPGVPPRAPR